METELEQQQARTVPSTPVWMPLQRGTRLSLGCRLEHGTQLALGVTLVQSAGGQGPAALQPNTAPGCLSGLPAAERLLKITAVWGLSGS